MSGTPQDRAGEVDPGSGEVLLYAHKPSLLGAPWQFRLRPDGLGWQVGRFEGCVAYDRIRRVRLTFRPATMQSRRFVAEVWPADGPKLTIASTSWRSLAEQAPQDAAYGAFVRALHARMAAAGARASFEAGSPPFLYWPGLAVFAVAALALAALTLHALATGAFAGATFVGFFLALFLWQSGSYFRRNRPGRYSPHDVPERLLPEIPRGMG
jgi:hypothetical protein